MSLGIVCDRLYNAKQHLGQPTYKDPADGQIYVRRQIAWLVKAVRQHSALARGFSNDLRANQSLRTP
jgi:hypothetical protein